MPRQCRAGVAQEWILAGRLTPAPERSALAVRSLPTP